ALDAVLVVRAAGLQQRLVDAAAAGDDADGGAGGARQDLLGARRQLDARLAVVAVVRDHGHVVARRARERAQVAGLLLDVAHDRALRQLAQRQDVADVQLRLLAAVHRLPGVQALRRDEKLLLDAVAVRVAERDDRQRRTAARV